MLLSPKLMNDWYFLVRESSMNQVCLIVYNCQHDCCFMYSVHTTSRADNADFSESHSQQGGKQSHHLRSNA